MLTLCCVCGKTIKEGSGAPNEPVSHGYCAKCMRATMLDNDCTWWEIESTMARVIICKIFKPIKEMWRNIWK